MTMVNKSCYGENLTGPVIAGDNIAVTTLHNNIFHNNCTRMFDHFNGQQTYGVVNTSAGMDPLFPAYAAGVCREIEAVGRAYCASMGVSEVNHS